MGTIWDFVSSILSNSIPSAVVMIGGILLLLLSGGAWGSKYDDKTKQLLQKLGLGFVLFGLILTSIIAIFQTGNSYPIQLNNIWMFITPVISGKTLFLLILFLIAIIDVQYLRVIKEEKKYKLTFQPVSNRAEGDANIIVNNISGVTINCRAILDGFFLSGEKLNVHDMNPDAEALSWKKERGNIQGVTTIVNGIPEILHLASVYGNKISFQFGTTDAEFDLDKEYKVFISFYRIKNNGFVKFSEFNGTIKSFINSNKVELEWVDK